ncbi:MAG: hypothetical protein KDD03_09480 [Gelidibacter sp.]|nr:hypothetical protein [Gelidibacter sp.]
MKFLISLMVLLMINNECGLKPHQPIGTISDVTQEGISITYNALSRGFFEKIRATKDTLMVSNDRNLVEKETYICTEKDWTELMVLLKEIDIESLPTLEAPTSKRLYDGAAHASLSIEKKDTTIQSNGFDHGYPPKAIERLVNKLLSMAENAQKQ